MASKKISRKKLLKEPDEFISVTAKFLRYFREHKRQIILSGALALAIIASGFAGLSYLRWQEGRAQEIQQEALRIYQEASLKPGNGEGNKENFRQALKKFQEALAIYRWGNVAQISHIYIGNCHYALKEYDSAIAAFSQSLEGPFRSIAFQGLGYSYEAKGDFAKAAENYQRNAEESGNLFQREGMLAVARCYEALNQKQKALEVYQEALKQNQKSQIAEFIQWKISELKG